MDEETKRAIESLLALEDEAEKPSFAHQGQAMSGYGLLAEYKGRTEVLRKAYARRLP